MNIKSKRLCQDLGLGGAPGFVPASGSEDGTHTVLTHSSAPDLHCLLQKMQIFSSVIDVLGLSLGVFSSPNYSGIKWNRKCPAQRKSRSSWLPLCSLRALCWQIQPGCSFFPVLAAGRGLSPFLCGFFFLLCAYFFGFPLDFAVWFYSK